MQLRSPACPKWQAGENFLKKFILGLNFPEKWPKRPVKGFEAAAFLP